MKWLWEDIFVVSISLTDLKCKNRFYFKTENGLFRSLVHCAVMSPLTPLDLSLLSTMKVETIGTAPVVAILPVGHLVFIVFENKNTHLYVHGAF